MKRAIVVSLTVASLLAPVGRAAEPAVDQFAVRVEIKPASAATFARVSVPAEIFRHTRSPDLADLRVFNAAGESLPYAWARPQAEAPAEIAVAVAAYPIRETEHNAALAGSRMEIRQQGGVTAVVVDGRPLPATSRVVAYLIDVRDIKAPAAALELDAEFDAAHLVPVTIEASGDLKTWRALARAEPVFRLTGSDAAAQSRTRVALSGTSLEGQYLRLTWTNSSVFTVKTASLKTVSADGATRLADAEIALGAPTTTAAGDGASFEWTLPTRASVSRISLALSQDNVLVPVTLSGRRSGSEPWAVIGRGVVYRLRDGEVRNSAPLEIAPGAYQALRVTASHAGPGFGAVSAPVLTLHFAPRELVFLARAALAREGFVLAAGNAQARSTALSLPTLLPGYTPNAERGVPLAALGKVDVDPGLAAPSAGLFGIELRILALWAVLIAAVLILSLFALSLVRKVNATAPSADPPSPSS